MSVSSEKTRFIPFRKTDIIHMLIDDKDLKGEKNQQSLKLLCKMLESIFHFDYHSQLEKLKDLYYPINPDINSKKNISEKEVSCINQELLEILGKVLNDANYDRISREQIEQAYENSALVGISVDINMDHYEFIEIYARGHRKDHFNISKLFGLKKSIKEHRILERVLIIAKLKDDQALIEKQKTIIKLFKDVPLEDLEILFPNSKVVMSLKDKLLLAIPAIAGGIPLLMTKVIPAVIVAFLVISTYFGVKGTIEEDQMKQAIAVLSALGALGGFIFKQISKYKSKKFHFQKELSDNLYFRNLVNNAGVFYSLIDAAEEEEFKEAIIAYYFLYLSDGTLNEKSLDQLIEKWFEDKYNTTLDFECDDALNKLKKLNLLVISDNENLSVVPINEALKILDYQWDNYFTYN